ncbi:hypothetical protein AALP_AA5G286200 [Arabis alpina]|uniref:Outer envelope membrane protein 7 n=1 Tax=Arabis alpina TaxID=50452 RepID=A0A087H001_ARAAL|nr:hypothetical protein AALP_AA5G286200 [Arabis alpina]
MEKSSESKFPKLEKPTGKKETATVVVGALAVAWLAIEFVVKPLIKKFSKSDSDEAGAPPTTDA